MSKLNICFFSGDITRSGGTERVASAITNGLVQKNGYDIFIVSLSMVSDNCFFEFNDKIKFGSLHSQSGIKYYAQTIVKLRNYIVKNKIDILVDIDTILQIYSIPATKFTKTKLVAWEHFNYYENLGVKLRDLGRKLAAKYADAIITLTLEDKDYFEKNLIVKCPIYQIYNPISIHKYKNEYAVDGKNIISVGRITHQKGFDYLVKVAKLVFKKHPEWQWYILGEGEDRTKIEKMIVEYGLHNKIILKGNVKEVDEYYKNASLFVLTSRYEGFGLVLTEAKAHGLPCVSFNCKAGPKEIILDGINGFLVDSFDITQMAYRICTLIESRDLRASFSRNALKDTSKFLPDSIINKWITLFDNLMK